MNINQRASEAAKAFLILQNLTTIPAGHIYAAEENSDNADDTGSNVQEIPRVVCFASDASEYPPLSGNYRLQLHVLVEASRSDTIPDDFDAMVNEVFSKIHTSTIHSDLSGAGDNFTCFGIAGTVSQNPTPDFQRKLRKQELIVPIYACASDIAA